MSPPRLPPPSPQLIYKFGGRPGVVLAAHAYSNWLRLRGDYTFRLVRHLVGRGEAVADIGASWGLYAQQLGRLVGPDGRLHVFEPHPDNRACLLAMLGNRANTTVYSIGLSDFQGTAELCVPLQNGRQVTALGQISSTPGSRLPGTATIRVPVDRLDAVLPRDGRRLSLLKCDVEGHERAVLSGASSTLERERPSVLIEIEQRHSAEPIESTFDWLLSLGYEGYAVGPAGLFPIEHFDMDRDQAAHVPTSFARMGMPTEYVSDFLFATSKAVAHLPHQLFDLNRRGTRQRQ